MDPSREEAPYAATPSAALPPLPWTSAALPTQTELPASLIDSANYLDPDFLSRGQFADAAAAVPEDSSMRDSASPEDDFMELESLLKASNDPRTSGNGKRKATCAQSDPAPPRLEFDAAMNSLPGIPDDMASDPMGIPVDSGTAEERNPKRSRPERPIVPDPNQAGPAYLSTDVADAMAVPQTAKAIAPYTHAHKEQTKPGAREKQDTSPVEKATRDKSVVLGDNFKGSDLLPTFVALSALPIPYRQIFISRGTFETMGADGFQAKCQQWAKKMPIGCSTASLKTRANARNEAVKENGFYEKLRGRATSWYIWDDVKSVWFRCITDSPPWEGCLQLEVQTLVESPVVAQYDRKVGEFLRKANVFEDFVKIFEPGSLPAAPSSSGAATTQPFSQEARLVMSAPPMSRSVVSQIQAHTVILFITIRCKPHDTTSSRTLTAHRMWGWTIDDIVEKFCPPQYVRVSGTTFELWDVLRDTDDIEPKPGRRILGYHTMPTKIEVSIQWDKQLIVVPMGAGGESIDQLVPDSPNVDEVSNTLASTHLCPQQMDSEPSIGSNEPAVGSNFIKVDDRIASPLVKATMEAAETLLSLPSRLLAQSPSHSRVAMATEEPVNTVEARTLQRVLTELRDDSVTHVELAEGNPIGDNGAAAIAVALECNSSLQHLYLHNNRIGDDGATAIANALVHNHSLQHLYIHNNLIGDRGATAIGAALKSTTSLQRLYLNRNQIGDGGAVAIGAALEHNTSLQHLSLDNNHMGAEGATAIGAALAHNTSLQQLYLHNNKIGADGAVAIGAALEYNVSLQRLYLHNNQIDYIGASAIGAALEHNTSLQQLHLHNNAIGDVGAAAIGKALERNFSLQQLYLPNNEIGDVGALAIGAALEFNTSLQQLSLDENQIRDVGAAAIGKGLEHNTSLQRLGLDLSPIRHIGAEFLSTRRLEKCTLPFDKLIWPPQSLASQGRDAIYSFLETVQERSAPLARSRLMFVGNGGSGKTTLRTALTLRGGSKKETVQQLRRSMIETIELRWTEADLQQWVDTDLAHECGFFSSCPRTRGLTGKRWLRLSASDVSRVFGYPGTFTSNEVVAQMTAVLHFLTSDPDDDPDDVAVHDEVPYGVLLNIPHVWTEGVELDTRWEEYTLWDFPGQMELYPSHRLFLACETAVYVLVVNGRTGDLANCMQQLHRWLSLVRLGLREGGNRVEARIVVTHTDGLPTAHRNSLLHDVHATLLATYADHFAFGDRCYATAYDKANGGDVDAVRAELTRLRSELPPNRPLPAKYQAICDDVVAMARAYARWPVVPTSAIDWRGQDEALVCLEDLGFVRRASDQVILEPVTWLSTLMSAFLHPFHGIGSRQPPPPLPEDATAATLRQHHIASVLVDTRTACQIVNLRKKLVDPEHESEVLPLLAQFDICFSPLDDGQYVFPSLLPPVTSLPPWLAQPFVRGWEGRRYSGEDELNVIPPALTSLLMERVVAMGRRLGGEPLFFGRGTVVMGCGGTSIVAVHLSNDDRYLDIFSDAHDILCSVALYLMNALVKNYHGTSLTKHRITVVTHDQMNNPRSTAVYANHPLLGPCRVDPVTTVVQKSCKAISPEWLQDEYENALPEIPFWVQNEFVTRSQYFLSTWEDTLGDRAHLLVGNHLVEETHVPLDIRSPADGQLVVVASCPHTMPLTNNPPFRPVDNVNVFDVFAHCEALQRAGRIRIAYDRDEITTASARDVDVIWSLTDPRLDGKTDAEKWEAVKQSVSESAWFQDSFSQIKASIKMIAQCEPEREIRLVCIRGGPINEVEQEYISKIFSDSHEIASVLSDSHKGINLVICTYHHFRLMFPL